MSSLENPFAFKPESDLATAPLSGRVNLPAFVSPLGLRSFTQLALVVFCMFSFVQMGSSFMQISLLNEAVSGPGPDWQQRATSNDQREIAVTLVQLVIFIVVGIISLKLLHRLRSNVDHLWASGLDSTPGWSVGWFFIPFAHLWKPLGATRQTWQASMSPASWQSVEAPGALGLWWFFWILGTIVGRVGAQFAKFAEDLNSLIIATWIDLGHAGLMLVSAICFLSLLNGITNSQMTTYNRLAGIDQSPQF